MPRTPIAKMSLAKVYPLLVQKAERKGRTREEVDEVTCWLTGYDADGLERQIAAGVDYETFFSEAPRSTPTARSSPARSAAWTLPPSPTPWSRTPATSTSSSTSSPAGATWRRSCARSCRMRFRRWMPTRPTVD